MKNLGAIGLVILLTIFAIWADIKSAALEKSHETVSTSTKAISSESLSKLEMSVKDDFEYFGLSSYLGKTILVEVDEKRRFSHIKNQSDTPKVIAGKWVGYRGRFKAGLVRLEGQAAIVSKNEIHFDTLGHNLIVQGTTQKLETNAHDGLDLNKTRYAHLPSVLAIICRAVEWLYRSLTLIPGVSWATALILLALSLKLLMAPISMLTMRWQTEVSLHREALDPLHREIKATLKGEKAHKALMKTYKERGITPYYTLKPFLATAIGLPILIAVFNMLGEIYDIRNTSFLWADSLAYPDNFAQLNFNIPFFGNRINLFPMAMTAVTAYAAFSMRDEKVGRAEHLRQRRGLLWMAAAFFFLFYNFPSGMILYWTMATLLSVIFRGVFKTKSQW